MMPQVQYLDAVSIISIACVPDFNGADVEAFFAAWETAEGSADVNADGGIDVGDIDFFFERWEVGC